VTTNPNAKVIHRADRVNAAGGVSALCFRQPKPIDLKVGSWTLVDKAVTCRRCRAAIAARGKAQ
jgi:hypothetical protein